jgi:PhnB protein
MSQLFINPYINFAGRAQEALKFYHQALGGDLDMQVLNPDGPPKPAKEGEKLMHARLEADGALIMGTDGMGDEAKAGGNISIALGGTDSTRLHKIFDDLSQDATDITPLKKESWGDEFGMFTDKFGNHWMINISSK